MEGNGLFQTKARVHATEGLNEEHWRLTLVAPEIAGAIKPSQFVNLRVSTTNDPPCRRHFTVFRTVVLEGGVPGIEIIYRVVGRGTRVRAAVLSRT
jgi:dihydroorotate dehydrogenase electron transfer subunit